MSKASSLSSRINQLVTNDPTTILDAEVFFSKWGEYPIGYHPPTEPMTFQELKKRMRQQGKRFAERKPSAPPPVVTQITHPDRVMLAANEYHHGTAAWRYEVGMWNCFKASEPLAFMVGKPMAEVQLELSRRGFLYHWI